jgi:pectate lyase
MKIVFVLFALVLQATAAIITSEGWLETFYVTWDKSNCASKYDVSYRTSGSGSWVKIDDELVREYNDHFRADVLGLKAGTYDVQVVPEGGAAMTETGIVVAAHDRSGFAFSNNVVPGAYNADGTLKTNAVVIYINDQNKNNITFAVKTASNGNTTSSSGLEAIIKNLEKGYENRPLAFRFIGKVTDNNFTLSGGGGDISIKDNGKNTTSYLTFEGVGNDATLYGWGFKTARATRLEIRNLGFMLTNSDEGDNVGLNTNSEYVWIHNNDMFYGNPGSDSDQVKGDGATDAKASTNITISYNHYWDNGKTHLLGNNVNETPGSITLHHNWYDHSDSRHPRVRKHYVHVYNNYYDGVATYGMGAVMASSIFAEKNYFRNTNRPLMISMQGTDTDQTFSKEDGGMIKAFSNFMDNSSKSKYKPYSSSNTVEFDAYEVSGATETVPNTVKAKQGGSTYNNSLIPSGYSYTTHNDSAAVRTQVIKYAGRYWGGNFTFAFTSSDDGTKDINNALKTKLQNYASGLVSGSCVPPTSSPSTTPSSSSVTPSSSSLTSSSSSVVTGVSSSSLCSGPEKFWNFSGTEFIEALPETIEESYTVDGLTIVYGSSDMEYEENSKSIDGYNFGYRFKFGGSGNATNRALKFDVAGACNIVVYGMSGNSSNVRALAISNGTTELQTIDFPGDAISKGIYTYTGDATSLYLYSKNSGINIYGVKILSCGAPIVPVIKTTYSNILYEGGTTVQIFNLKGNMVRSLKYAGSNYNIPLDDLPNGLYIAKVSNASGQKTVKVKVLKTH